MYSLVLLDRTDPVNAITPATINVMPVSRNDIFVKKAEYKILFQLELVRDSIANITPLIAQIIRFIFRTLMKLDFKDCFMLMFS